jgi:hypothetical protein
MGHIEASPIDGYVRHKPNDLGSLVGDTRSATSDIAQVIERQQWIPEGPLG